MSEYTTALRHLEAYVQEEIGAQSRLLTLLQAQEAALRSHSALELAAATASLDRELESTHDRARRRQTILESLARKWSVAASSLSLTSVVERVGDEGERLARQRGELERATRKVQRLARRNAVAANYHQRLTAEVLQAVLAPQSGGLVTDGGGLVDAEA